MRNNSNANTVRRQKFYDINIIAQGKISTPHENDRSIIHMFKLYSEPIPISAFSFVPLPRVRLTLTPFVGSIFFFFFHYIFKWHDIIIRFVSTLINWITVADFSEKPIFFLLLLLFHWRTPVTSLSLSNIRNRHLLSTTPIHIFQDHPREPTHYVLCS